MNDEKSLGREFSLSKLIYTMCGVTIAYNLSVRYGVQFLFQSRSNYSVGRWTAAVSYGYPGLILLFSLAMVAAVLPYRPIKSLFVWSPTPEKKDGSVVRNVIFGLVGGLVASAVPIPAMFHADRNAGFVAEVISRTTSPDGIAIIMLLLLLIALPISTEMVFRGIVFRTLAEHASVPSAVVGSCLLFAYFSPVFNPIVGAILGVVCAILHYRTRSLVPPIIANGIMTLVEGGFFLYRAFT